MRACGRKLGDDSDATGCVAGALAGTAYGFEAIPKEWIEQLRGKDVKRPVYSEITITANRRIAEVHDSPDKTDGTEREHMVEWFRANEAKGSGSYSRQVPNQSARR